MACGTEIVTKTSVWLGGWRIPAKVSAYLGTQSGLVLLFGAHPCDRAGNSGVSVESMILVIGNLRSWEREGRAVPVLEGFRFVSLDNLDQEHLTDPVPDVILSALMGENFDAIDVARRLAELGFTGRYRALSNVIPNADSIREEIREVAPDLEFDLFLLRPAHGA